MWPKNEPEKCNHGGEKKGGEEKKKKKYPKSQLVIEQLLDNHRSHS